MDTICILHAGTEKTGTTSLQRFLAMNATTLSKRGIWVPRSLVRDPLRDPYNHTLLSTASRLSVSKPDDLQRGLGLLSMDAVHEHRRLTIEALTAERNALSYTPSTIIVSNEHIHSRLCKAVDLAHAKDILAPFCSAFRIVVYLRRQCDLAQSLAFTALRNGAIEFRQIPDFNAANGFDNVLHVDHDYFDYLQLLQRLERVFGATAIDVRLYEKNELCNNDVVQDFFSRIGCEIADMPHPSRENTSMRQDAILFLTNLNRYIKGHPAADSIRGRILNYLASAHSGTAQLGPTSDINQFMSSFATSNEEVRARWFAERKALFSECDVDTNQGGEHFTLSEPDAFNIFIEIIGRATNLI